MTAPEDWLLRIVRADGYPCPGTDHLPPIFQAVGYVETRLKLLQIILEGLTASERRIANERLLESITERVWETMAQRRAQAEDEDDG